MKDSNLANIEELKPQERVGENKHHYKFNYCSDSWRLCKDNKLTFHSDLDFSNRVIKEYKDVLFWYAENYSPSYTVSLNSIFSEYIFFSNQCISIDNINSFLHHLKIAKKGTSFTRLRTLLCKWNAFYPNTVSFDLIKAIRKIRVTSPQKGRPVRSRCPIKGPFTDIERQNIVEKISFAFEKNKISQQDYALIWFFLATGRRLNQASALNIGDLINNNNRLLLNIPRAKQRNSGFRDTFRTVELTREIYLIFEEQKNYVVSAVKQHFKCELSERQIQSLPFFIDIKLFTNVSIKKYSENMNKDIFHMKTTSLRNALSKIAKDAEIYSERTNALIRLNSHRFRYTIGCILAREGANKEEIAFMLDHSDTQSVDIYVENPAEFVYELTETLDQFLTPIAKAFKGNIVDPKFKTVKNIDKKLLIRNNTTELGSCGTHSYCSLGVPIPCYTCQHFNPWKDINIHKPILIDLLERRKMLIRNDVDMDIVITLDNTIYAVSEIVNICKDNK